MIKSTNRKPCRRQGAGALFAMLTTAAALTAGALALAPASALAVQTEQCSEGEALVNCEDSGGGSGGAPVGGSDGSGQEPSKPGEACYYGDCWPTQGDRGGSSGGEACYYGDCWPTGNAGSGSDDSSSDGASTDTDADTDPSQALWPKNDPIDLQVRGAFSAFWAEQTQLRCRELLQRENQVRDRIRDKGDTPRLRGLLKKVRVDWSNSECDDVLTPSD